MMKHWIWFANAISPFGRISSSELLDYFGSAEAIYNAEKKDFVHVENIARRDLDRLCRKNLSRAEKILDICEKSGINIVTMEDKAYPSMLKNVFMPPPVLYYRGTFPDFDSIPTITIVGTREATKDGERAAYEFAAELSDMGLYIVSGMAYGVDTKANEGGLFGGTPTVAVLGCGVDVVYPPTNKELMSNIIKHGVVISEFPPGTRPLGHNFPVRNRIMAALGLATVVIEAPKKSGALITASLAADLGKDVLVVPGGIYNSKYEGSNNLIKSGCIPVTEAKDVIEHLPVEIKVIPKENTKTNKFENISSPAEKKITELLLYHREMNVDNIISESGLPEGQVISALMMMEINDIVKNTGGGNYAINE